VIIILNGITIVLIIDNLLIAQWFTISHIVYENFSSETVVRS